MTRARRLLLLTLPALFALACEGLDEQAPTAAGPQLEAVELTSTNMVPQAWGNLVSVTSVPDQGTSLLWFQDDSGAIRVVAYRSNPPQLWSIGRVIRRN